MPAPDDTIQELTATLQAFPSPAHAIEAVIQWAKGADALGDLQMAVDDAVVVIDQEDLEADTVQDEPED